jgi:hypothetical protein
MSSAFSGLYRGIAYGKGGMGRSFAALALPPVRAPDLTYVADLVTSGRYSLFVRHGF